MFLNENSIHPYDNKTVEQIQLGGIMDPGVILTSARYYNALAVTRCLGRHGIRVACGDDMRTLTARFPLASYSRYCKLQFRYPSYELYPEKFIDFIIKFARKNKDYKILMPIDAETLLISKYKDKIKKKVPQLRFAVHDYEYVKLANNKGKLIRLANEIGVPTPQTFIPKSFEDLHKIAETIKYPAIIKLPTAKGSKGLSHVKNQNTLIEKYKETLKRYSSNSEDRPLIQEYIPGTGYGVSCLFNKGELRALFTHKRIRESSFHGGPSVARVSVRHPKMEEYALKLLKRLKWHGMAMVEFKLDERDKKPKLMEINPRFYGSVYQAIASDIEFPYLLYKMLTEGDIKPVTNYKLNVKTRYIGGDIRAFPDNFLNSEKKLSLLKDFLNFREYSYDDFSLDDPIPFILQFFNILIRLFVERKLRVE